MATVGRVLFFGPAFFIALAVGCTKVPLKVTPANPVIVEDIRVEGVDRVPADAREALQDLPLRAGMVLTDELEKSAGERAVEILQNHGYSYAQVGIALEPVDTTRARASCAPSQGQSGSSGPSTSRETTASMVASFANGSHTHRAICSGEARSSRRSSA
ncbi:MAG TPA: hypothetical protein VM115_13095 [Vicinamibacterales bacterium]|nr:hypothetical protein [Vicinamibacterales bacterium]